MPEGHTIHRLAIDLARDFEGKTVRASSPQGRFVDAELVDGQPLERAHAVGKHLFLDFPGGRVHIHLGLFGKLRRRTQIEAPRETVRLRLSNDEVVWDLTGPTACHLVSDDEFETLVGRLGADPLAEAKRSPRTWARVHASRRAIGALLLDQSIFAGIGNVYRAELLFLVGLHPATPGTAVPKATFERLWSLSKELLRRGVKANRIVTVANAGRARRGERLYVYKQANCRVCGSDIEHATLASRTIYFCPMCQRDERHDD